MSLFNENPSKGGNLFKNEPAFDPEWVPKLLPYREFQQKKIAECIKPLLQERNGRNIFIFGSPGIGKTAAVRWVLRDLEDNSDEVIPIYVNCWQKNTSYKIIVEICQQLGYNFIVNKKTEELFEVVKNMLNKKSAVLAFDEVDKLEEIDFLYTILNEIYKKSVLLITNERFWIEDLEDRVQSRLLPEVIEFKPYSAEETQNILRQRIDFALKENVCSDEALRIISSKAFEAQDVRIGLHLLRESTLIAEENSAEKITEEHANSAIAKLDPSYFRKQEMDDDSKKIIELLKENNDCRIGDLFKLYQNHEGKSNYKTFQRRIERLEKAKFINTNKIIGGKEGTTTIISCVKTKTLEAY